MDRICKHCGLPIENPTPHQQAHKQCQREKNNEYQKEYWKRKRNVAKPKKEKTPLVEKFCLTCGKPLAEYGNRRRDYCPECSEARHKESLRKWNEQTKADCKDARRKKVSLKPKKRKKPVPHCWDLECKSIMQVDIEARALGLTYGKYEALCESLFIEPYLAEQGIHDGLDRADKAWREFKREKKRQEEVNRLARANSVLEMGVNG